MCETDVGESSSELSVSLLGANSIIELDDFENRELSVDELVESLHAFGPEDLNGVIYDSSHKNVEVDQVYINRDTLKAVMA